MDQVVVRRFRAYLRIFERELDRQNSSSSCCGVTLSQCHTLLELSESDHISLNRLSEKLSVDKSAASRTVESLVQKNLVHRIIPEENRRTTLLNLTGTGARVCEQIHRGNDDYYSRILADIPASDLDLFLRTFERIVYRMSQVNRNEL